MRDFVNLASVPIEEDCISVEPSGVYVDSMKKECNVFKHQLMRMFPTVSFRVKSFPHDFGVYSEVVACYDDINEEMMEEAWSVQDELPSHWDKAALAELRELGMG